MRTTIVLICCFVAACGPSGPPTRGVPVTFSSACEKGNEGKRIMLEGYLDFPQSFGESDDTIMLRLHPTPSSFENVTGASAKLGSGPNSVEMPPKLFKKTDLKVHTADGQVIGYGSKVKVSGSMYYPSSLAIGVEFKCGLSDTLFEPGSSDKP